MTQKSDIIKRQILLLSSVVLCLSMVCFINTVYAYTGNGEVIVHVTTYGEKYHTAGCSYLRYSDHEMRLENAIIQGYTPCSDCDPPIYTGEARPGQRPTEAKSSGQSSSRNLETNASSTSAIPFMLGCGGGAALVMIFVSRARKKRTVSKSSVAEPKGGSQMTQPSEKSNLHEYKPPVQVFTIGHSNLELDHVIQLLKYFGITYVIDVRSDPHTKYAPAFDRETLAPYLKTRGMTYHYMGKYLGSRPEDPAMYDSDGFCDFELVRASEQFQTGFQNLLKGIDQGARISLMCTEADPFDCHRAILIGKAFQDFGGVTVEHIRSNGTLETQTDIEKRLLEHFANKTHVKVHSDSSGKKEYEWIEDAYRLRNKEIGHKINNERVNNPRLKSRACNRRKHSLSSVRVLID